MENEILWKWELLCEEFEEAKRNWVNIFEPIISNASLDGTDSNRIFAQLKHAESAWKNWTEVQDKIKQFVDDNT
jgi:hypothetical protein